MGRKSLADKRRAEIIEAMQRCVVRDGLAKASIQAVATEAGFQKSVVLHYFESREELIEELVESAVAKIRGQLDAELEKHKKSEKRLEKAIDLLLGPSTAETEYNGLFYDCWSESFRSERVRKTFTRLVRNQRKEIMELFAKTESTANLSPNEMQDLANIIIALYEGLAYISDMDSGNVSLKRISKLAKNLIQLYATGKGMGET